MRAYDITSVGFYGSRARFNFPDGLPSLGPVDNNVVMLGQRRVDRVAHKRIAAERAREEYVTNLRHMYPERVEEDRRAYEVYRATMNQSRAAPIIDLVIDDDDEDAATDEEMHSSD